MDNTRVEYKVMPEQGIVIARIYGTDHDAIDTFNRKFFANTTSALSVVREYWNNDNGRFTMPRSFKAIARCHPEDVFDEEKGKKIALNKLSEKYNHSLDKHLANIMLVLDKTLKNMDEYFEGRTF